MEKSKIGEILLEKHFKLHFLFKGKDAKMHHVFAQAIRIIFTPKEGVKDMPIGLVAVGHETEKDDNNYDEADKVAIVGSHCFLVTLNGIDYQIVTHASTPDAR